MAEIPSALYCFLPYEAALQTLNQGTLPLVSPASISGPYQFSEHTPLGFDLPALHKYLVKYLLQMLFAPEDPAGNPNNPIIKAVRRWRNENRFTDDEEATQALYEITRTMVATHFEKISDFYQSWCRTAMRQRILRLSADIASVHAWDAMADGHRGVALRLRVGADHAISAPKKVVYRSIPTFITSLREQIKVILGEEPFPEATEAKFESRCLCQPKEYSYRREWRCFRYTDDGERVLNVPLQSTDVKGMCFGLALSDEEKQQLVTAASHTYPKMKYFESSAKVLDFAIDFKPWRPA